MMEITGYFIAILIGISLGMIGSGGSILTVPVLVYMMHIHPLLATTSSLFIVGTTSLAGGTVAYFKKQVALKALTLFGIPSIISIFITRHFILPAIPSTLFTSDGLVITKDMFLMLVFAILMLGSSWSILRNREPDNRVMMDRTRYQKALPLGLLGLVVGIITGLLGAGGGFLIIPCLVIFLKLPMKTAVGTSLLIIAINSLFGFLFSLNQFSYDWPLLLIFTVLGIAGIFIGSKLADKVSPLYLKKGFGWFVLIAGIYIILKELGV